jgi:mxaJ protein
MFGALLCTRAWAAATEAAAPYLKVCADPNNLPFSNAAREGFENEIVDLVAHDLGVQVRYTWWAQRRGFVRNTLGEQKCDLWPGVATGVDSVATTAPYYRSQYVFVTRAQSTLAGLALDDPRLKTASIGIQMIGDDANNTPPAHAIARRGLIQNVRGFPIYGDYELPSPGAGIVEAVASGNIDVAIVWGPTAGYFSDREGTPLRIEPVRPSPGDGAWPMAFDISMGVRKTDTALRARLNEALARHKSEIDTILEQYGVPRSSGTTQEK